MFYGIFQGIMQSQMQGQEQLVTAYSDFINAICLFAVFLIIFAVFFCIRMVSNTSFALKLTTISFALCMGYAEYKAHEISDILAKTSNLGAFTGAIVFLVGCFFLFKGLGDEEDTEDYVHNHFYWFCSIIIIYIGLLFIALNTK